MVDSTRRGVLARIGGLAATAVAGGIAGCSNVPGGSDADGSGSEGADSGGDGLLWRTPPSGTILASADRYRYWFGKPSRLLDASDRLVPEFSSEIGWKMTYLGEGLVEPADVTEMVRFGEAGLVARTESNLRDEVDWEETSFHDVDRRGGFRLLSREGFECDQLECYTTTNAVTQIAVSEDHLVGVVGGEAELEAALGAATGDGPRLAEESSEYEDLIARIGDGDVGTVGTLYDQEIDGDTELFEDVVTAGQSTSFDRDRATHTFGFCFESAEDVDRDVIETWRDSLGGPRWDFKEVAEWEQLTTEVDGRVATVTARPADQRLAPPRPGPFPPE